MRILLSLSLFLFWAFRNINYFEPFLVLSWQLGSVPLKVVSTLPQRLLRGSMGEKPGTWGYTGTWNSYDIPL